MDKVIVSAFKCVRSPFFMPMSNRGFSLATVTLIFHNI